MLTAIKPFNIFSKNTNAHNEFNCAPNTIPARLNQPAHDTFIKSTPSFTGIHSASEFRNLVNKRVIHCIYCGRPLMSNKLISKLKSNGTFSGTIRNFACEMIKYIDYLHPTEKETLKRIVLMSFDEPNIGLSTAIKKLYPEANKELLKEQKPILKELAKLSEQLPYGYKTKFQKLLKITRFRLEEKAYIPEEFSGKEFSYKIKRVSDTIKDESIAARIIKLTEPLTHPIFKTKTLLNDKFVKKILTITETRDVNTKTLQKSDLQLMLISQIKSYAAVLKRQDIINFCNTAIDTIEKRPVKVKFSNKSFRYELNEILDGMPDEKLKYKIIEIAKCLPTSRTSVNAFITKHELAASDAVGYDLLRPSIVTIEHIHPKSAGGVNELYNYALSCERDNNTRSSESMQTFIKDFDIKNQQKYFKEILDEAYRDNLSIEIVSKMLNVFIRESDRSINLKDIQPKTYRNMH